MNNILNAYDISKYVAACSKRAGVNVQWEDECQPRTDGKTIWLPRVHSKSTDADVLKLKNFVRHETAHITYSDFDVLKNHKPQGLLMFVDNLIEDHRVDWLNDSEFEGDLRLTDAAMIPYMETLCATTPDKITEQGRKVMCPLFLWDAQVRLDMWNVHAMCDYLSIHSDMDVVKKLHVYDDELRTIRTIVDKKEGSEAAYDLAKRILREVFDIDPATQEGKSGASEGAGEEGQGDEGGKEGEGGGKGDGEDGKGKKGKGKKTGKLREVDMGGMPSRPYAPHNGDGVNAANYTTGDASRAYIPDAPEEVQEWDFTTNTGKNMRLRFGKSSEDELRIGKHMEKSASFANVLRTKLQVYSRDRWEYGKKKGKLHSSALWRTTMKDASGYNERVFKERLVNKNLDVCIQLLVDASGSMAGEKFENAAAAACLLNETLANVLHLPVEILAFTDTYSSGVYDGSSATPKNTMFVLKNFDRQRSTHQLAIDFSTVSHCLADNVDGESLAYGYNRIKGRKEKRKIMVVLSDGSPCGGHHKGSTSQHTKDVIKAIENSAVELMGVGIMYDAVKHWYKHHDTIPLARDIEPSLIRILDNLLFRS